MEREMCGYLEWNLNVGGEEVVNFEQSVRAEFGPRAVARSSMSDDMPPMISKPSTNVYPTPDTTPDVASTRPIRPVPSPYKHKSYTQHPITTTAAGLPSPPASPHNYAHSPQPPHFSSNTSSLQSSPASDDCKTPSPVAVGPSVHSRISHKGVHTDNMRYESRRPSHSSQINLSSYPINVGGY
jgi:hypothetical protein